MIADGRRRAYVAGVLGVHRAPGGAPSQWRPGGVSSEVMLDRSDVAVGVLLTGRRATWTRWTEVGWRTTYDAQVGRPGFARVHADFITRDTVLSEHPYLYCEDDPVSWADPEGSGVIGTIGGWVGGGIGFAVGGPLGAAVGAGLGTFGGDLLDGDSVPEAALDGITNAVLGKVGGTLAKTGMGKLARKGLSRLTIGNIGKVVRPVGAFVPPKAIRPPLRPRIPR